MKVWLWILIGLGALWGSYECQTLSFWRALRRNMSVRGEE